MITVPTETALEDLGGQTLFIHPEHEIDLAPEKEVTAAETLLYTQPAESGDESAENTTAWD